MTCFCGAAGAFPRCSCSSAGCWRTMLLAMVRVLGCQSCSPGGTWRSVFAEHSGGCWWPLLLELNWEVRGQAVPQALGPSLQGEMCLLYEDMGCGGSWQGLCTVGAARPICNRGGGQGTSRSWGGMCSARCFGLVLADLHRPHGAAPARCCRPLPSRAHSAGCFLLLQFLAAICGQGSTRGDTKPVTSAPHS